MLAHEAAQAAESGAVGGVARGGCGVAEVVPDCHGAAASGVEEVTSVEGKLAELARPSLSDEERRQASRRELLADGHMVESARSCVANRDQHQAYRRELLADGTSVEPVRSSPPDSDRHQPIGVSYLQTGPR